MQHNQIAIKAILFDFGGVLAEEGFANGLIALAREQNLQFNDIITAGMQAVYDSGFVLGHGTAADFWKLLRQRTRLKGDDSTLTERILDGFRLRDWMLDLVDELHSRGYVTGILSDQTHWLNQLDQRDHFYSKFDHIYNSYNLGKGKRDPSLFSDVAGNLNLPATQILFIDDNENNTQRAHNAGMKTIVYRDRKSFIRELYQLLEKE